MIKHTVRLAVISCLLCGLSAVQAQSQLRFIGVHLRPDEPFPQFARFWHEGWNVPEGEEDAAAAEAVAAQGLGASLHIYVYNTGSAPVPIEDITIQGTSLKQALTFSESRKVKKFASIHFAGLSAAAMKGLLDAGEPVWWKADPPVVPPKTPCEIVVRLRSAPKVPVNVQVPGVAKLPEVQMPAALPARFESISFSPDLGQAFLYIRRPEGSSGKPTRVMLDGRDVGAGAAIHHDPQTSTSLVILRFQPPLAPGSFHVFQAILEGGGAVNAGARAWSDEFAYGMWGAGGGKEGELDAGRRYLDDLAAHHINVQMPQMGSAALQALLRTPEGRQYMSGRGIRMMVPDVGKLGISDPFALFIHDEPDAGDYRAEGLPDGKKVGSLAQWCLSRVTELRAADPKSPQLLNVDMTYKPQNWYTYGQLPDIFAVDPYYQSRLRGVYWQNPDRLGIYAKATYVYAVAAVAESACAPRPLHVILNSVATIDKANNRRFRCATAPEKRIEVYYALGGGAKGLSYWWYTPAAPAHGVGAWAKGDAEAAALWREIGLLGAEARTVGPLLVNSCPAELPVQAPRTLWMRTLLCGSHTMIALVVNEQYANDRLGTVIVPATKASVAVTPPAWMKPTQAFEVTAGGLRDAAFSANAGKLAFDLGQVEVTRMIVLTSDAQLRGKLESLYKTRFAASAARLAATPAAAAPAGGSPGVR